MQVIEAKQKLILVLSLHYDKRESELIAKYYFEDKNIIDPHYSLNDDELTSFNHDLDRFGKKEPLQYITSVSHFYGYQFYVDSNVLIPRPETEELVYQAIQIIKTKPAGCKILDIGTGSGCIPIVLAKSIDVSHKIKAIDISEESLKVAKRNAEKHAVEMDFIQLDFLDESLWSSIDAQDVIISNPPYISDQEKDMMHDNVLTYEPHAALFSKEDPLLFYKKIAKFAKNHCPNATILCEINEHFGEETFDVFIQNGFQNLTILKDLQQKDRILLVYPSR